MGRNACAPGPSRVYLTAPPRGGIMKVLNNMIYYRLGAL